MFHFQSRIPVVKFYVLIANIFSEHMGLSENVGLIFPMIASHLKTGEWSWKPLALGVLTYFQTHPYGFIVNETQWLIPIYPLSLLNGYNYPYYNHG